MTGLQSQVSFPISLSLSTYLNFISACISLSSLLRMYTCPTLSLQQILYVSPSYPKNTQPFNHTHTISLIPFILCHSLLLYTFTPSLKFSYYLCICLCLSLSLSLSKSILLSASRSLHHFSCPLFFIITISL